jgi:hypothetical protein
MTRRPTEGPDLRSSLPEAFLSAKPLNLPSMFRERLSIGPLAPDLHEEGLL